MVAAGIRRNYSSNTERKVCLGGSLGQILEIDTYRASRQTSTQDQKHSPRKHPQPLVSRLSAARSNVLRRREAGQSAGLLSGQRPRQRSSSWPFWPFCGPATSNIAIPSHGQPMPYVPSSATFHCQFIQVVRTSPFTTSQPPAPQPTTGKLSGLPPSGHLPACSYLSSQKLAWSTPS